MTIVICRAEDFRDRALHHGADTFVHEAVHEGGRVTAFRLHAMRADEKIATLEDDRTDAAWLWRDRDTGDVIVPEHLIEDGQTEPEAIRERTLGEMVSEALQIAIGLGVFAGIVWFLLIGFSR